MTLIEKVHGQFREAADLATRALPVIDRYLVQLAQETASRVVVGGKVLLMGNGGSAADAQHIAGEFVVKLNYERAALPASKRPSVHRAIMDGPGISQLRRVNPPAGKSLEGSSPWNTQSTLIAITGVPARAARERKTPSVA